MATVFDYTGEDAIELLADTLEPAAGILADEKVKELARGGGSRVKTAGYLLRAHKGEILEIFARVEGVPVEDYKPNALELVKNILDLLGNKEFTELFTSQGRTLTSSGSVTENTTEAGA